MQNYSPKYYDLTLQHIKNEFETAVVYSGKRHELSEHHKLLLDNLNEFYRLAKLVVIKKVDFNILLSTDSVEKYNEEQFFNDRKLTEEEYVDLCHYCMQIYLDEGK